MKTVFKRVNVCGLQLLACLTVCALRPTEAQAEVRGPFQDDSYRYPELALIPRTAISLLAVPANVVTWDSGDWARFSLFAGSTVALMLPTDPSPDVHIQRWIQNRRTPLSDQLVVRLKTVPMTIAIAGLTGAIFSSGWLLQDEGLLEYGSLMLEALAVTQFYHVTSKLLLGREGPHQGDNRGRMHGPTTAFFPGGTPSGHAASTYAILTVAAEYWDSWPLRILAHTLGIYVGAAFVYHNAHYVSDVIWGAAMGYYIGKWVVKHRSSKYRYSKAEVPSASWMPMRFENHGVGIGLTGTL